jgi:hypothetical protein
MHRTWKLVVAAAALAAVVGSVAGCSKQGEGQRCSRKNNDDDCDIAGGLVCVPAADLRNGNQSDICCPPTGATDPACIPGALGQGGSGGGGATTTTTPTGAGGSGGSGGSGTGGSGTGGHAGHGTGGTGGHAGHGTGGASTTKDGGK